ncbi:hypothetical protein PGT21_015949 [Puccinia graminis f. sp. tritici]|uniref:Uncharacterized protein n=1 Tax=Puccinia graminis f. sp. tritici TaxID=56615 RepID=A0A5B0QFB3_PUCGR|nr:hypothetical protein PGT21_015949 [Puccinia graminis f. sp. tritici]
MTRGDWMTSSGRSERCTSAPDFRSNIQPQSAVGRVGSSARSSVHNRKQTIVLEGDIFD